MANCCDYCGREYHREHAKHCPTVEVDRLREENARLRAPRSDEAREVLIAELRSMAIAMQNSASTDKGHRGGERLEEIADALAALTRKG